MDKMIDHVNQKILIKRGYDPMPLHLYSYYQKVCAYSSLRTRLINGYQSMITSELSSSRFNMANQLPFECC